MGDISAVMPKESRTVLAIYKYHEEKNSSDKITSSIPISKLGGPCDRQLWYTFRHCVKPEFKGRMLRLFETGNLQEARFAEELEGIGCEVHTHDHNGRQFLVTALGGHVRGYMDGCVLGVLEAPKTWHVAEFKTHNAKSWRALKKHGLQKHKPDHYAQTQIYMHLAKPKMKRALYLAVNKDTDELYAERVRYDKKFAEELMERAECVIRSNAPPERISDGPDFYQCKWCDSKQLCFGGGIDECPNSVPALPLPVRSCRQCCHSTPWVEASEDGTWVCTKHSRSLCLQDQLAACDDHLTIPALLPYVEPQDYGKDEAGKEFIYFNDQEYGEWYHGNCPGAYTTLELMKLPAVDLGSRLIQMAKCLFDANVDNACQDILERYPESDCEIVWKGRSFMLADIWFEKYGEDLKNLTPIRQSKLPSHVVNEYSDSRIAVLYPDERNAEIRKGKE